MEPLGKPDIIVGLDIGTTKICTLVAEVRKDDTVEIIGVGKVPSMGLRKGIIVNLEETVKALRMSIEAAEMMSGVSIGEAFVGIAGSHISCVKGHGIIAVGNERKEIMEEDVLRVIETAKSVSLPADRRVIHVLPVEYMIDGQRGIRDPRGMSGSRLEVDVLVITGLASSIQNVIKSVDRTGLTVKEVVLEPLASAQAVLSSAEKELGVAVVDIGGGTMDLIIFVDGGVRYTSVIPVGGDHITNDLAVGLRTPIGSAEEIKLKYGCAMSSMVSDDEMVEINLLGGRSSKVVSRKRICDIIEPRIEEMFVLLKKEIMKSGTMSYIPSGLVITGGVSLLDGIADVASNILDMSVRIGSPVGVGGLVDIVSSPIYSTGVGLIKYGYGVRYQEETYISNPKNAVSGFFERLSRWFSDFF